MDEQTASSSNNSAETKGEEEEDADVVDEDEDEGDLGDMIGMRCRAPYGTEFGHKMPLQLHNAIILDVVDPSRSVGEMEVRVLYSNPMFQAMKPCQFYLEDRCSFDDTCRCVAGVRCSISVTRKVFSDSRTVRRSHWPTCWNTKVRILSEKC